MPPIVLPEVLLLALAAMLVCLAVTQMLVNGRRSLRQVLAVVAGACLMLWLAATLLELAGAVPVSRELFRRMQLVSGGLSGLAAALLCLSLPEPRLRLSALPVAAGFAGVLLRLAAVPISGHIPDMAKLPSGPEGLTVGPEDISPDPATVLLLLALALGLTGPLWRFRGRLFPEAALSLERMVKQLPDRVAVFDGAGGLLDRNLDALPAGLMPEAMGTLDDFLTRLSALRITDPPEAAPALPTSVALLSGEAGDPFETLLPLAWAGEDLYLRLHAASLPDRSGARVGLVCSLQDVTEACRTARLLQRRNDELEALNRELSDYLHIAGTLEAEREHNRVSRQIHETLGQRLTAILSVLEVVRRSQSGGETPMQAAALDEAIAGCRAMMKDIRAIVSGLLPAPDGASAHEPTTTSRQREA